MGHWSFQLLFFFFFLQFYQLLLLVFWGSLVRCVCVFIIFFVFFCFSISKSLFIEFSWWEEEREKGSAYSRNSSEGLLYNKAKGHRQQATQTKRVSRSQHKVKEIQFCWLHDKYKILWTSRPSTQNVALNTDFRSSAFLRSLISSQVSFLIFHSHTVLLFSLGHILPFLTIKSLIQLSINFSILKIKT